MNKIKLSVYCFLFALALTTTIHAGEARQIRAVFVDESGSSTRSILATANATISGTSLHIFLTATDTWIGTRTDIFFPYPLIFRYFDEDGSYLGRFKTSDLFMPKWIGESKDLKIAPPFYMDKTTLFDKDTEVAYKVNARDAAFLGIIELSLESPPEQYAPKFKRE